MRAVVTAFGLTLIGCGPVHLGDERLGDGSSSEGDAASADGETGRLQAHVAVRTDDVACSCFVLSASASYGRAPYAFEWEDGSHDALHRVCAANRINLLVRDAAGAEDHVEVTLQETPDAACPPPPQLLCLENTSFEGTPGANFGIPNNFNADPWSVCNDTGANNTPEVANKTIPQWVVEVPNATDGETFLGMGENEQISQKLCRGIYGGSIARVEIDLARLYIGAGVASDSTRPLLQIWGGIASECSARELLWESPIVQKEWKHFCVTLKPQQFMDLLVLRAGVDSSQGAPAYLIADNLKPVLTCP